MSWHVNILTLFPEMFPGPLGQSLSGKALERGDWSFNTINIRDYADGVHKSVDDTPYGGGAGMVMRADIIEKALLSIENPGNKIYLSPRGKPLTQSIAQDLAKTPTLTLLCGRYEGVDQRVELAVWRWWTRPRRVGYAGCRGHGRTRSGRGWRTDRDGCRFVTRHGAAA